MSKGVGGLLLVLALGLAIGCSEPREPEPDPAGPVAEPNASGPFAGHDTASWITVYDPEKTWDGYTLDLYRQRTPILFDMNGRIVHAWPDARVKSRVRLLPDGSILALGRGRKVVEYDWHGNLTWSCRVDDAILHHDVVRLGNGNTLLVVRPRDSAWDALREVDRERRVVWEWRAEEHLGGFATTDEGDVTHVNSVEELPPNPWFDAGDIRFRPGNLLVSARNLNLAFVVDRASGEVVWTFGERLDLQHEALMIPPAFAGHGNVLILSNGYRGTYGYRRSRVLEVRPTSNEILWEYAADGFFTPTGGVEQPLPNGNVLVTSTRGGRTFEVTRGGEIVWQWTPPFDPVRSRRYARDHCPQLAALGRPRSAPVAPAAGYFHVDRPAYRFAGRGSRRTLRIRGETLNVLKENDQCRKLLLPSSPAVEVVYGLERKRLADAGLEGYSARFALRLEADGGSALLFEETVDLSRAAHRSRTVDLGPWAHRWVRLCVETEEDDGAGGFAYWTNPAITSAADARMEEELPDDLTEEERRVRREHLEALGYVD